VDVDVDVDVDVEDSKVKAAAPPPSVPVPPVSVPSPSPSPSPSDAANESASAAASACVNASASASARSSTTTTTGTTMKSSSSSNTSISRRKGCGKSSDTTGTTLPGAIPVAGINSNTSNRTDEDDGDGDDDGDDLENGTTLPQEENLTTPSLSTLLTAQAKTETETMTNPPTLLEAELVVENNVADDSMARMADQKTDVNVVGVVYDAEEVTSAVVVPSSTEKEEEEETNNNRRRHRRRMFVALATTILVTAGVVVVVVVLLVVRPSQTEQDASSTPSYPSASTFPPATSSPTLDPDQPQWVNTLMGGGDSVVDGDTIQQQTLFEWNNVPDEMGIGTDAGGYGTTVDMSSSGQTVLVAVPFSSDDFLLFKGQIFCYDWHPKKALDSATAEEVDSVFGRGGYWKRRSSSSSSTNLAGPVAGGLIGANGNAVLSGDGSTVAFSTMLVEENSGIVEVWRWVMTDEEDDDDNLAGNEVGGGEGRRSGRSNVGEWVQLGSTLRGSRDQAHLGSSLALSEDGNTLALGALMRNESDAEFGPGGPGPGRATVYDFVVVGDANTAAAAAAATSTGADGQNDTTTRGSNGEWIMRGESLEGRGIEMLGRSIDLSANGQIVAVSAYEYETWPMSVVNNSTNSSTNMTASSSTEDELLLHGRTAIYQWDIETTPPSWKQLGSDIVGASNRVESIALSRDGKTVAVTADSYGQLDLDGRGSLRVFDYFLLPSNEDEQQEEESKGGEWIQRGQAMYQSLKDDLYAITLSENGQRVASSILHGADIRRGQVEVHEWDEDSDVWTKIGQTLEGSSPQSIFGHSLALNGNGTKIVIGDPGYTPPDGLNNISGRLEIYEWKDGL